MALLRAAHRKTYQMFEKGDKGLMNVKQTTPMFEARTCRLGPKCLVTLEVCSHFEGCHPNSAALFVALFERCLRKLIWTTIQGRTTEALTASHQVGLVIYDVMKFKLSFRRMSHSLRSNLRHGLFLLAKLIRSQISAFLAFSVETFLIFLIMHAEIVIFRFHQTKSFFTYRIVECVEDGLPRLVRLRVMCIEANSIESLMPPDKMHDLVS